jgi:MFS family permease
MLYPSRTRRVPLVLGSVGCLGAFFWAGLLVLASLADRGAPVDLPLFFGLVAGGLIGLAGGIVSLRLPKLGGILLLSVGGVGLAAFTYPRLSTIGVPALLGLQELALFFLVGIFWFWPAFFVSGGAYAVLIWIKHRPKTSG